MYSVTRFAFATACICAVSALAQEAVKSNTPTPTATAVVSDEARIKATIDYWTPDRLAAAIPMPLPKVDRASAIPNNVPSEREPVRFGNPILPTIRDESPAEISPERFPLNQGPELETEATPAPDAFNYVMPFNNYRTGINNQFPYSTMGKLFFTIPPGATEKAGSYVCSAAVVGNLRIVVTARHCMWDFATKKWYNSWAFYPEWNNGASTVVGGKNGAWYPEWAYTWTSGSSQVLSLDGGYDIGIFVMHDGTGTGCGGNKGKQIGDYTGAMGYAYGFSDSQTQWNMFGYPQAAPFEGNYLYQNNGATGAVNPLGSNWVAEAGDPQTGGTSGGPWVIGFNPDNRPVPAPNNNINNGNNFANGVNSFVWTNPAQPLALNGTIFFSGNFLNLYKNALALKCS